MDIGFEDGRRNFGRNFGFENEREAAAAAAAAAASAHSALHFSCEAQLSFPRKKP